MTTLLLCLVVLTAVVVYNLGLGLYASRRAAKWKRFHREEATRAKFAEARSLLWQAVISGELSPHSATFRLTNHVVTAVMRRPDQYELLAHAFMVNSQSEMHDAGVRMQRESASWGETTRSAVSRADEGVYHLIWEWSRLIRILDASERWFRFMSSVQLAVRCLRWLRSWIEEQARSHDDRIDTLFRTRGSIRSMLAS